MMKHELLIWKRQKKSIFMIILVMLLLCMGVFNAAKFDRNQKNKIPKEVGQFTSELSYPETQIHRDLVELENSKFVDELVNLQVTRYDAYEDQDWQTYNEASEQYHHLLVEKWHPQYEKYFGSQAENQKQERWYQKQAQAKIKTMQPSTEGFYYVKSVLTKGMPYFFILLIILLFFDFYTNEFEKGTERFRQVQPLAMHIFKRNKYFVTFMVSVGMIAIIGIIAVTFGFLKTGQFGNLHYPALVFNLDNEVKVITVGTFLVVASILLIATSLFVTYLISWLSDFTNNKLVVLLSSLLILLGPIPFIKLLPKETNWVKYLPYYYFDGPAVMQQEPSLISLSVRAFVVMGVFIGVLHIIKDLLIKSRDMKKS